MWVLVAIQGILVTTIIVNVVRWGLVLRRDVKTFEKKYGYNPLDSGLRAPSKKSGRSTRLTSQWGK